MIWVVIPVYNEERNIKNVLKELLNYNVQLVVVNDGSQDHTNREVERVIKNNPRIHFLTNEVKMGKGSAMRKGCDYCVEKEASHILLFDGDGQHDPRIIPILQKIHRRHPDNVILGVRHFWKERKIWLFGNWLITGVLNFLYKSKFRDSQSGLKFFPVSHYSLIKWNSAGYFVESEIAIRIAQKAIPYSEVIFNTPKMKNKGTSPMTGVHIIWKIILFKFNRH